VSTDRTVPMRRGFILTVLYVQYPMALARPSVEVQVASFYDPESSDLARDLAYLEGLKLIEHNQLSIGRATIHTFILTPLGVDVVLHVAKVQGVEIER